MASTRISRPRAAPTRASTSSARIRSSRRWSPTCRDEEIWRLNRGGHDARKVYAAYHAAVHTQGPADRHPRQDRQGLRPRQGRPRARWSRTSRRSWTSMHCGIFATASVSRFRTRISRAAVPQAARGQRRDAVPAGAPPRARRLSAGAAPHRAAAGGPAAGGLQGDAGRHRRARDLHHHGLRAHPHGAAEGQEHRQAHRADRAG